MSALSHFGWLHDKRGRFLGKIIYDDPEVAHDLFEVCTKWNWIPFAQSLDLNADKLSARAVIRYDINSTRIPCGWHDVPTKQRKVVTTIVETNIAGDLWIQFHGGFSLTTKSNNLNAVGGNQNIDLLERFLETLFEVL